MRIINVGHGNVILPNGAANVIVDKIECIYDNGRERMIYFGGGYCITLLTLDEISDLIKNAKEI